MNIVKMYAGASLVLGVLGILECTVALTHVGQVDAFDLIITAIEFLWVLISVPAIFICKRRKAPLLYPVSFVAFNMIGWAIYPLLLLSGLGELVSAVIPDWLYLVKEICFDVYCCCVSLHLWKWCAVPHSADIHVLRGASQAKLGDYEGAVHAYTQAIQLDPKNVSAYQLRAEARRQSGDYYGAAADYTHLISQDSKNALAYKGRILARNLMGDHSGEIDDCNQLIRLDPNDGTGYRFRGLSRSVKLGDYSGAIEDFTEAILLNPNDSGAFAGRGACRGQLGNYREAIDDYTQAIQLNPRNADAFASRGYLRSQIRDQKGAIDDFKQALVLDPTDIATSQNLLAAQSAALSAY